MTVLRDDLQNIFDDALLRTPRADRAELADYVMARIAHLDRPLTVQRLHSLIGAAWNRMGIAPIR
ncbi:MAG: hypothetical protein ACRECX_12150 [Methyloceanibacter sp.]|uniref:hypothetical protein n=1 Tax=Methyloceanibacter sp. TaxID=1965321 RepID=UPI003D6DA81F